MSLWAIGDLHLSGEPPRKPMDIFDEHWHNHFEKIQYNWLQTVAPTDTVIICGDTSWALKLPEAIFDLTRIAELPGRKLILRGNHDYWWTSLAKMQAATQNAFSFLQNNYVPYGDLAICATRGWLLPSLDCFTPDDTHIYEREAARLELSLKAAQADGYSKILVAMHYPPIDKSGQENLFTQLLAAYGVKQCVFGHIHGRDADLAFEGERGGVHYKLVSCDTQDFKLSKIE